jgi:hypothetical protein
METHAEGDTMVHMSNGDEASSDGKESEHI